MTLKVANRQKYFIEWEISLQISYQMYLVNNQELLRKQILGEKGICIEQTHKSCVYTSTHVHLSTKHL